MVVSSFNQILLCTFNLGKWSTFFKRVEKPLVFRTGCTIGWDKRCHPKWSENLLVGVLLEVAWGEPGTRPFPASGPLFFPTFCVTLVRHSDTWGFMLKMLKFQQIQGRKHQWFNHCKFLRTQFELPKKATKKQLGENIYYFFGGHFLAWRLWRYHHSHGDQFLLPRCCASQHRNFNLLSFPAKVGAYWHLEKGCFGAIFGGMRSTWHVIYM